jgi:predicted acyltransferase
VLDLRYSVTPARSPSQVLGHGRPIGDTACYLKPRLQVYLTLAMSITTPLPLSMNDSVAAESSRAGHRLLSLDAFRGLTILAMILVNDPGSWEHIYWPLEHAKWFGWTPTDLVFPFFLFIVGTSLAYSLRRFRPIPSAGDGSIAPAVYWRIVRRTAILILLGLIINHAWPICDWLFGQAPWPGLATLRIPGVLQRIALVYFAVSLIALHMSARMQVLLAGTILLGYWALLAWLPNPHDYQNNLSRTGNVVRVVDRAIFGDKHLYTAGKEEPTDPEGLLSTFPAIVTGLAGYWAGLVIQRRGCNSLTVLLLIAVGAVSIALGLAWGVWFPISKKLWTSSFVLLTAGLGAVGLAVCLWLFDVRGWRRLAYPLQIAGVNAIAAYMGSELGATLLGSTHIGGQSTQGWLYETLFTSWIADPRLSSLAFAVAFTAFCWLVLWGMSRRGWAVRV